jgi:zinc and cadmium transporter
MLLISIYCGLILLASLAGGWLPLTVRLTHTRIQVGTSFVAGLMLGAGVLHLLPQAWALLGDGDRTVTWMLAGFLTMFLIQRFLHYPHHDVAPHHDGPAPSTGHVHTTRQDLSWAGAAAGLGLHTVINGFALGAAVAAGHSLGAFLAIVLHKPFDAMTISLLMASGGRSRFARHLVNGVFALLVVVGVVLFQAGVGHALFEQSEFLGLALAFSAGTFLCIAASDLLPELHFHRHDRVLLTGALIAGVLLAVLVGSLEHAGHSH